MKITPLDIQQQQFRVRFRGFDIVEVDNFLDLVANEFEELLKENNLLREEGRRKSAKISELEAMEKDLREALVSVQRITEEMKNNARKEAELIVEEAKAQAQKIIDNAQAQALKVEEEINELKRQRTRFESSLRSTLDLHLKLLDTGKVEPGDHSG
jgi:cell division initiation protein